MCKYNPPEANKEPKVLLFVPTSYYGHDILLRFCVVFQRVRANVRTVTFAPEVNTGHII
jgi:hypothetical protein